jgi:hypothetical protein
VKVNYLLMHQNFNQKLRRRKKKLGKKENRYKAYNVLF